MPKVINPTADSIFCHAAGAIVPARGAIDVTQDVADAVPRTVFRVECDTPLQEQLVATPAILNALTAEQELQAVARLLQQAEQDLPGAA